MDPEYSYADMLTMAKRDKPQWPPVAAGEHFCMVVADAAWQTGRVATAVKIKFLRGADLVKCAHPGQCPRRDFGTTTTQSAYHCDKHARSYHAPALRTAAAAPIPSIFKVTHTVKSSSGGWRGPAATVPPLAPAEGEVTRVAADEPAAREPAAAAVLTDDAPCAAAAKVLAGASAHAGASYDSDSVESVRAVPAAPAAPASLALTEDRDCIVRLAFEHCGCDVDDESFQQEVLDAVALQHDVLVECEGFPWAGPMPLSSNYPWELHESSDIAPLAWSASTSGFLTSRTPKCKRLCTVAPCSACTALADSEYLALVVTRASDDGIFRSHIKNCFLTRRQLQQRYELHRQRLNVLKLALLAANRRLSLLVKRLDDSKRAVILISQNKIPRLHELFAVQLKRGATPNRILEQLKLAVQGSYRASGNKDDAELDKALLVAAIAPRLLPMLNQEDGFATKDSIRKHHRDEVPRFVAFVCDIELAVLVHNFEKQIFSSVPPEEMCLWHGMIDAVACDEGYRPSPNDGALRGVCQCASEMRCRGLERFLPPVTHAHTHHSPYPTDRETEITFFFKFGKKRKKSVLAGKPKER